MSIFSSLRSLSLDRLTNKTTPNLGSQSLQEFTCSIKTPLPPEYDIYFEFENETFAQDLIVQAYGVWSSGIARLGTFDVHSQQETLSMDFKKSFESAIYTEDKKIENELYLTKENMDKPFEIKMSIEKYKHDDILNIHADQFNEALFNRSEKVHQIPISTIANIEVARKIDYIETLEQPIEEFILGNRIGSYDCWSFVWNLFSSCFFKEVEELDRIREKTLKVFGVDNREDALTLASKIDGYARLNDINFDSLNPIHTTYTRILPSTLKIKTKYNISYPINFDYFNEAQLLSELFYVWKHAKLPS